MVKRHRILRHSIAEEETLPSKVVKVNKGNTSQTVDELPTAGSEYRHEKYQSKRPVVDE